MAGRVDVAVLGLGTMGTFACLELARRGLNVAGIDQFSPPHDRGSHSGATRVFRTAYAEHPDYVPLAVRAGALWDRLGEEAGTELLHRCGMLSLGPETSALIAGTRASAAAHALKLDDVPAGEVRSRFPAFDLPSGWSAVFEPAAGWVDVDAALRFGLEQAARARAHVLLNTQVTGWRQSGGDLVIETPAGQLKAARMVITAGAWSARLLAGVRLPLRILRKTLVWVDPIRPEHFAPGVFPVFASADRFFYGFPNIGNQGVKIAIHWSASAPEANADEADPEPEPEDVRAALEAAAALTPSLAGPLPAALQRVVRTRSCLYSMTPDEHFVIDRHPAVENVWFAAGFSGHGFKFAPAIGEALADLATTGKTGLPVEFLSLKRLTPQPS